MYDQYETPLRGNRFVNTEFDLGSTSFRRNPFLNTEFDNEWMTGSQGHKLHLNKFIHQSTLKITESGITATTGTLEDTQYERTRYGNMMGHSQEWDSFDEISGFNRREPMGQKMVKCNRAFAFVVKHNPTNQLLLVGRVIDAAQHKINDVYQTINSVDQL